MSRRYPVTGLFGLPRDRREPVSHGPFAGDTVPINSDTGGQQASMARDGGLRWRAPGIVGSG